MAGQSFDASSEPNSRSGDNTKRDGSGQKRRFLGVRFDCCRTYGRVYINHQQTAFVGHCPRCGKQVHFKISPDGVDAQFFSAG